MNEVGFNKEYTMLQLRYGALKERVANQIEMLHSLVCTTGPNIKARYMMFVGRLEYKAYELKVEFSRWKRRFALRQAALNRGETPDLAAIEATLKREFAEFLKEMKRRSDEIKENAKLFSSKCLSDKEDTAVRVAYLNAVKKLHPDLNPNLSKAALDLWNEIQSAYAKRDWEAVRLLAALADSVADGVEDFASAPDATAALREACEKLETKSRELTAETVRIQKNAPFTYKEFLDDEEAVTARQNELKIDIAELKAKIAKCEEEWNNG
ncbi:MAG: hypothetical protein IJH50_13935 [Kiritimatiellae bacterium]|nr:hypothetical protein [Kiritimatiellia bacterium]